jgi:hypothetical protein
MLFSPAIYVSGIVIKTVYIFLVLPAIFGAYRYKKNEKNNRSANFIFFAMLISILYSLVMFLLMDGIDSNWIKYNLIGFVLFFSSYYLVKKYQKSFKDNFQIALCEGIYFSVVLHSVIVILVALNNEFRNLLYLFISQTDLSRSLTFRDDEMTRFSGIVQGGFGSLSLFHSLGLIIGVHLYKNENNTNINGIKLFVGSLLILYSMIYIGRLGILVSIIGIFMIIIKGRTTFPHNKKSIKLICLTIIALIIIASYIIANIEVQKIKWAFEIFIKLYENYE